MGNAGQIYSGITQMIECSTSIICTRVSEVILYLFYLFIYLFSLFIMYSFIIHVSNIHQRRTENNISSHTDHQVHKHSITSFIPASSGFVDLNPKKTNINSAINVSLWVDSSCILDVHDSDKEYLFNQ